MEDRNQMEIKDKWSKFLFQLKGVQIYGYPTRSAEAERRLEIFYTSDDGYVEQYVVQCKNEYAKDAWIRDIAEAMIKAGKFIY